MKPKIPVIATKPHVVTPFVGVWIETIKDGCNNITWRVTPFVGVWIETCCIIAEFVCR